MNSRPGSPWEYVLDDSLELVCSLDEVERKLLLHELRQAGAHTDSVESHSTFSLDGHLVVILKDGEAKECWHYLPKQKKIIKHRIKK